MREASANSTAGFQRAGRISSGVGVMARGTSRRGWML